MSNIDNYDEYHKVLNKWNRLKKLFNRTGALNADQTKDFHLYEHQLDIYAKRTIERINNEQTGKDHNR